MTTTPKKELPEPHSLKGALHHSSPPMPDHANLRIPREKDSEALEAKTLTFQEETLCLEFVKDNNWLRACRRAGLKTSTDLRMQPHIRKRLEELHAQKSKRHEIEADAITQYLYNVVTADPNELAEVQIGACRHCWGYDISHLAKHGEYKINHHYQFRTVAEQKRVKDANNGKFPAGNGGIGYAKDRAPNPECPYCDGHGETNYIVKDTNTFSNARFLIKALKINNGQVEVQTHDKLKAAEMLLKVLGAFESDNKQKNAGFTIHGGIDAETIKLIQAGALDREEEVKQFADDRLAGLKARLIEGAEDEPTN